MTDKQIEERALETYPEIMPPFMINMEARVAEERKLKREGYIKAFKEVESLPKIKGWVTRDKKGYGNSKGWLRLHFRKPKRTIWQWDSKDEFEVDDSQILEDNMFPEITWKSKPKEVELIIRIS